MSSVQVQFVQCLSFRVESFNSCPVMCPDCPSCSCTAVQFEYLCIKGEGISLKSYFVKEADVFGTVSTL